MVRPILRPARRRGAGRLALATLAAALVFGVRAGGQTWPFVALLRDESCPVRVVDARRETNPAGLDLVVTGTIANPTRRAVRALIVTAALVDADGRVTHLHMKPVELVVPPRSDAPFRVTFEGFAPTRDERVAFGVQAVQWSRTDEWRGTLKLVAAPAVVTAGVIVR